MHAISLIVLLALASAQPPTGHVVRGRIVDLTTRHPVPHLAVAVSRVAAPWVSRRTTTDSHGSFSVRVPWSSAAIARMTYKGVPYSAPVTPDQKEVDIPVFDTTSSDVGIVLPDVEVAVTHGRHGYMVAEQWSFANAAIPPRVDIGTGVPAARRSVTFPLPAGARQVAVRQGNAETIAARVGRGAVVVDGIVRPALRLDAASALNVTYRFTLPAHRTGMLLPLEIPFPAQTIGVVGLGVRLVAPGFSRTVITVNGHHVGRYVRTGVDGATMLTVGLDTSPATMPAPSAPIPVPAVLISTVAGLSFALLLLIGLLARRPRRVAVRRDVLLWERARLVEAIARLDIDHDRGTVPSTEYLRRRAKEKRRLVALSSVDQE